MVRPNPARSDPMSPASSLSTAGGRRVAAASALLGVVASLFWSSCSAPPEQAPEPVVFYPFAPAPPRIQFLKSISHSGDIEDGQTALDDLLFGEEEVSKVIQTAYGCVARDGKVYVCDPRLPGVIVLDLALATMEILPTAGRGGLISPINLCFAPDGRLYVADSVRGQVVVFGPDLNYEGEFGPFADKSRPVDVEATHDRLYVIDILTKQVHVLDRRSGEELFSFGQRQASQEILVAPTNLTLDAEGNIYVVDTIRCEVLVFDSEGTYSRTIGVLGDGAGAFARPKGIAHAEDLLFVIDAAFANCQVFGTDGVPRMFFGGGGSGPGQMYLPAAIWVGTEGLEHFEDEFDDSFQAERLIIVSNQYGPRKLNFYALGRDRRFDYEAYEAEFEQKRLQAVKEASDEDREGG